MKIQVSRILPNPEQPRTAFDGAELQGLAQSIKETGLIQPVVVERAGAGKFILVDGERRWRAVKILGRKTIEAVIRARSNPGDGGRRLMAMVANVQRTDLAVIEQAKACRALGDELGSDAAAQRQLGVPHAWFELRVKLLNFAEPVQQLFNSRKLPLMMELIYRAQKLPYHEQTRILTLGATRGWTGKALIAAITQSEKQNGKAAPKKRSRAEPEVKLAGKHFDALALVPKWRTLPALMADEARKTCQACDLYDQAGQAICKCCPLPDFLARCSLTLGARRET